MYLVRLKTGLTRVQPGPSEPLIQKTNHVAITGEALTGTGLDYLGRLLGIPCLPPWWPLLLLSTLLGTSTSWVDFFGASGEFG